MGRGLGACPGGNGQGWAFLQRQGGVSSRESLDSEKTCEALRLVIGGEPISLGRTGKHQSFHLVQSPQWGLPRENKAGLLPTPSCSRNTGPSFIKDRTIEACDGLWAGFGGDTPFSKVLSPCPQSGLHVLGDTNRLTVTGWLSV